MQEQAKTKHSLGLARYAQLKSRTLSITAALVATGLAATGAVGGAHFAEAFALGGGVAFLYQLLLNRSIDSMPLVATRAQIVDVAAGALLSFSVNYNSAVALLFVAVAHTPTGFLHACVWFECETVCPGLAHIAKSKFTSLDRPQQACFMSAARAFCAVAGLSAAYMLLRALSHYPRCGSRMPCILTSCRWNGTEERSPCAIELETLLRPCTRHTSA